MRSKPSARPLLVLLAALVLMLPLVPASADEHGDPDHPYDRPPTPDVVPFKIDDRELFRVWDDPRSVAREGDDVVALTFDDGPHPQHTPQILDTLDAYGVPGTFFMVGSSAENHPGLVADAHARGHGVANHTFTHPALTELSDAAVLQEVRSTHDVIEDLTGRQPDCLRPPFGDRDERVLDIFEGEGYASAMWSNDPRDWERPGSDELVQRVLDDVSSGDVIILHDGPPGNDRSQTVDALPDIIEGVQERGYEIVPFCHPPMATERLGGVDRWETAVLVSQRAHPEGTRIAYLAVGDAFPDALAGAPAAAGDNAPVLLTRSDELPGATQLELQRLDLEEVVLLGGPDAINEDVAVAAGRAAGAAVTRLGGEDRFATAAEIAQRTHPGGAEVVYLAVGDDFPDALAGGAAAAGDDAPILLVEGDRVPAATATALDALDPDLVLVLGGPAAVSGSTAQAAAQVADAAVDRLAGEDRYGTAAAIAERSHPGRANLLVVATGEDFPDALAGSAYAGAVDVPVLLVASDRVPFRTAPAIERLRADAALVVGGTTVISPGVRDTLSRH